MTHKVRCKLYIEFKDSKLPVEQVKSLVYMWVFQNINNLDHTGELVETWSATVDEGNKEEKEKKK